MPAAEGAVDRRTQEAVIEVGPVPVAGAGRPGSVVIRLSAATFSGAAQEAFQMIINSEPESGPSRSVYARGVVREYGMRDDRFKSILNPVPDSAFRSSERC